MIPVLLAALLVAAAPADTVYTVDGGRIAGTVLEESPTTGVTIQTPDGTVRRIERNQISRIEFADGTVSNVRPPTPPPEPAPAAAAAARPAAAEGPLDSVYFRGGGRARGNVVEESPTAVKVRLLDASIHVYPADEVARIEYADGTVSTPRPQPAKSAEAAPAPVPRRSIEAPTDTVYFMGGGRVRGTVIEENPKTGVKVRLLDGTVQTYPRDDLVRIEYADGSVSRRVAAAPAQAPAPVPLAPVMAPAPVPPPAPAPLRQEKPQLFPLYFSVGAGVTFLGGDITPGQSMSSTFESQQAHLSSEVGLRLSPAFVLGVYGEVGGGDPASSVRDECQLLGTTCTASTGRYGFMVRHTWAPLSRRPTWLSLGTGWEFGGVMKDGQGSSGSGSELFSYRGRELIRVGAGVDFRSNDVLAFGLYGTFSAGEYDRFKDPTGTMASIDRATHTTAQVGLRLTLFP